MLISSHRRICASFLVVLCICVRKCLSLDTGAECFHQSLKEQGICQPLSKCPKALELIRKGTFPQNCGSFEGSVPVVCCPSGIKTTTSTTTTIKPMVLTNKVDNVPRRKATIKCHEYSYKYTYKLINPVVLLPGAKPENVSTCGFVAVPLIVGGTPAMAKEFPHMALIGFEGDNGLKEWQCGGSLISERFVLTAGHCITHQSYGEAKYIRLGEYILENETDDARVQDIDIEQIIKHPEYRPPSQYNDIALMKMKTNARMSEYVRPACLHTTFDIRNDNNNNKVIASGWGRTDYLAERSNALLKVTLDLFTQEKCNQTYKNNISARRLKYGIVPESQVCAGSASEKKDTCQGDSGGPLQVYNYAYRCMYNVVGVTSFGKACGLVNSPGVYTRVSNYIGWIENIVWP